MRTALVTGASRGIGAAIVVELKKLGYQVLVPTRQELDLSNAASIGAYFAKHGNLSVDVLINNAGINFPADVDQLSFDTWSSTLQVNLSAPFLMLKHLLPFMKKQKWGRIVQISSIFAGVSRAKRAAYTASKAGLEGLTRALAVELGADNILVNSVAPGYTDTELTKQNNSPADIVKIESTIPLGRLARPEEIAKVVAFLCSEENSYVTGQTLCVDGGFTCQ